MLNNEVASDMQPGSSIATARAREVAIAHALPVQLQNLDFERHIAIDPNGKRYVVATFDDTHLRKTYVTAVYPQQNGYLTLIRLGICEVFSETVDQAMECHVSLIRTIQQGELDAFVKSLQ